MEPLAETEQLTGQPPAPEPLERPSRTLPSGRSEDARRGGAEHGHGGDSLSRRTHTRPVSRPPSSAQRDSERIADRAAEVLGSTGSRPAPAGHGLLTDGLLLGAWDLGVVVLALTVTGAFGASFAGWLAAFVIGLVAVVAIGLAGAYPRTSWLREHPLHMLARLVVASTALAWAGVLVTLALGLHKDLGALVVAWITLPIAWYVGRRIATRARRVRPERVVIVGSGVVARRAMELLRRPGSASVVIGCVDDGVSPREEGDPPTIGVIDDLPRLLADMDIDRVIVAFSSRRDYETLDVLRSCTNYRGAVDIVPRFFDFVGPRARMYRTETLAFLSVPGRRVGPGSAMLKRSIDLVGSIILLIVLSPLLLLIALAILIDSGRPVLFRQRRIGMHGAPFSIIKLRTLSPEADPPVDGAPQELESKSIALHVEQAKQEAARRATRVGAVLRKTSLDELPNLFNVVVGEMSLVGPRPLSPLEDAALDGWELLRRDMRPGITGLWQVSGRSEVSWENRINLDYAQVRHWSLASDLHVLADTVRAVVRRTGAG
jgi:exopolysaccharide biosynthesis polyprenyl glycosylphosphotransferase